jgi:cell division protein FtsI (penicillin-binding protein 3)
MAAQDSRNSPRARLAFFAAFLFLWVLAIGLRLIWLQLVQYGDFNQRAARQQQRSVDVAAARGVIYDRNGHELAMTIAVDSVFAVPSEIPDQATTASLLGRILKTDPRELLERMSSSHAFCWIARKLDPDTSQRIRALNLRGIYFQKESKRFYPKRELAAQVLGYVGLDDEGLAGLERAFDQKLSGTPGKMLISMDAHHHWLGRIEKKPDPGQNIVLTIDEKIQYIAERELDVAMQQTHAEAGTVVVQNPKTGEILALANRPTFNPNSLRNSDVKSLKNRSVSDVYEPGSTFKMVTIAAALEEKITNPDEVVDCQMGSIVVAGKTIHDWKPYGLLSVSQILERSSDVGAIKLGLRLGDDRMYHYIRSFGFGSQTGIELPGETRGITKPVSRWSKISIGAISMGQEIGVSPLQLVSMTSAMANDGIWIAPRIVAGGIPPQSSPHTQMVVFHPAQQHRIISSLTAAQMRHMLEGVVLFGTGKRAILDGYTSAGKTGTAQKINPVTHTYDRVKHIASFSGFSPVNNPAITITVILDSPVGAHHGGDVAAPIFARIAQPILEYLNVPHDVEVKSVQRQLLRASLKPGQTAEGSPDHLGEDLAQLANNESDKTELQPASVSTAQRKTELVKASEVSSASALPATEPPLQTGDAVAQNTKQGDGTVVLELGSAAIVPSFLGKPLREVVEEAQQAGIEVDVLGSGLARQQNPPPGSRLAAGGHVAVRFAR